MLNKKIFTWIYIFVPFLENFYFHISARLSGVHEEITPGPVGPAADLNSIEEFWDILFPQSIIEIIVLHTNNVIEAACLEIIKEGKNLQTYHRHTDIPEIKAFIAILYFSGLWKSSQVNNEQLWSKMNGITFYRCAMPLHRFLFLSTCLRFDDKETRDKSDKFAPIRTIWDLFIANCTRSYTPSRDCTVDEQLLGFRGHCSFRVYIKSKPDKYGLKLMSLNDSNTSYMVYIYSYFGKYYFYSVFY